MKKAQCIYIDELKKNDLLYVQLINLHDEFQGASYPQDADSVGDIARQSIISGGEYFNLRCPLDAEYKVGETWAQTH